MAFRWEFFEDTLQEMEEKFTNLVWYARNRSCAADIEHVPARIEAFERLSKIEVLYPNETSALRGERGCVECGFFSGCLAVLRLVLRGMGSDMPEVEFEEFPDVSVQQ